MSYRKQVIDTPVGKLTLVERDGALCAVLYKMTSRFAAAVDEDSPLLKRTKKQLGEYFAGKRRDFDLPLAPEGTAFQQRVWAALRQIPYGKTRTYKDQAIAIARPTATRAVGRSNGLNPLSIVVPCHRVIGSSGALTGYAGGLAQKSFLLRLEGCEG
jgi:methylated-DNA-[protein]-cysteine S-methyltransferase